MATKVVSKINWENTPSTNTPINEDNLNQMDNELDTIDDRVVQLMGYETRVSEATEQCEDYADLSKSYAVGTSGTRTGESTDNSKYYMQQAKTYAQNSASAKASAESARDSAQSYAQQAQATDWSVVDGHIGTLSNLTTTAKTNLVSAVNEVNSGLSGKQDALTNPLVQADIVDNLTSTDANKPLSAKQGNVLKTDIGTKASLNTTSKTNLVGAINEVNTEIGNLTGLKTTVKTNVVSSVNEVVDSVGNIKTDLDDLKVHLASLGLTVDAQGNVIDIWESEV